MLRLTWAPGRCPLEQPGRGPARFLIGGIKNGPIFRSRPREPEGPGSVSGAPNLPAGFSDTFSSRYVRTWYGCQLIEPVGRDT
jgi:hypothetical protein